MKEGSRPWIRQLSYGRRYRRPTRSARHLSRVLGAGDWATRCRRRGHFVIGLGATNPSRRLRSPGTARTSPTPIAQWIERAFVRRSDVESSGCSPALRGRPAPHGCPANRDAASSVLRSDGAVARTNERSRRWHSSANQPPTPRQVEQPAQSDRLRHLPRTRVARLPSRDVASAQSSGPLPDPVTLAGEGSKASGIIGVPQI